MSPESAAQQPAKAAATGQRLGRFAYMAGRRAVNRNTIRCAAFFLSDLVATAGVSGKPVGGLAVVRLNAIGDFVLWLDCARRLRELHRDERITLVANVAWAELARALPYWDEVIAIDVSRFVRLREALYRWRVLRGLRARGFTRVLHPVFSRSFLSGDSVVRAIGAPEATGFAGDLSNITPFWKRLSDRWYSRRIDMAPSSEAEIARDELFVRALGAPAARSGDAGLPAVGARAAAIPDDRPYFVLVPGASRPERRWPAERFAVLAQEICRATGWLLVLCGSAGEHALAEAVAQGAGVASLNLAGRTTLVELVETVRGARLLIGNESAPIHFAAATGTPSVAIVGGGHFGRFVPYPPAGWPTPPRVVHQAMPCYGCNWVCSRPYQAGMPFPCLATVSQEHALDVVMREVIPKMNEAAD